MVLGIMPVKTTDDAETFFMAEVERALVPLIHCVNQNYEPSVSRSDLEITYNPNRASSADLGGGKIVFGKVNGWHHGGTEYKMFKNDHDLWTHGIEDLKFRAWWLTAHELSHHIVGRIWEKCVSINAPCTEEACKRIVGSEDSNDWPESLLDLINHQGYWKKYASSDLHALHPPPTPHGIFYQHIYRTMRREVVNPRFGIDVGPWKQKKYSPPKNKHTRRRFFRGRPYL